MSRLEPPFYPIVFVRGYAGTEAILEDTVATPFMGFNLGSTKVRQRWDGAVTQHVFESPLVRLMKDYGYLDAYREGAVVSGAGVPARTVFVYRYYDEVAERGDRREIEAYARGLGDFIQSIRDLVAGGDRAARDAFRVYLVGHSMGGLVCRCFLQNPGVSSDEARRLVDKVYTYGTPHDGLAFNVLGNVPGFFSLNNADNFNRTRMREYLDLPGDSPSVNTLSDRFETDRFFCLVGTDDRDYPAFSGWTRRLVGPMSDGLVQIASAAVRGTPRAFVHRSHSGHFGMVNSEEGYQNLVRFLFGDARVDGVLKVKTLTLPSKVQRDLDAGRRVRASYHFEVVARCRGVVWDMHRRTVGEASAVFRTYDELFPESGAPRHPYLFSLFLSSLCRVNTRRASLGFSVDLGVPVPEYEIDGAVWREDHHEGGYLYRDKLNFALTPPATDGAGWSLRYGADSRSPNRATGSVPGTPARHDAATVVSIPIRQTRRPGIDAELELRIRPWNGPEPAGRR